MPSTTPGPVVRLLAAAADTTCHPRPATNLGPLGCHSCGGLLVNRPPIGRLLLLGPSPPPPRENSRFSAAGRLVDELADTTVVRGDDDSLDHPGEKDPVLDDPG